MTSGQMELKPAMEKAPRKDHVLGSRVGFEVWDLVGGLG